MFIHYICIENFPLYRTFYNPEAFYGNSKLAQILFTRYLSAKLSGRTDGFENIVINAVPPGIVDTGLYEYVPYKV